MVSSPIGKPIRLKELFYPANIQVPLNDSDDITVIHTGKNLGFAGANNVGLRWILNKGDFAYVWLLNNDTVVDPLALTHLIYEVKRDPKIGICGSTLLYYDQPNRVQALGGASYNRYFSTFQYLGFWLSYDEINEVLVSFDPGKMACLVGASMLATKEFILRVGMMGEEYFLYYDEIDWAIRGKDEFALGYAPRSVVYHKEGAKIGSNRDPKERTLLADYFGLKNRLVFTKKYYRKFLPTVYLGLFFAVFNRIRRKQWDRVKMLKEIILNKKGYFYHHLEKPLKDA